MKTDWQIQDFLADESFVNWANGHNRVDIDYWEEWIQKNPEASEIVATAKYMVKGIPLQQPQIPQVQLEKGWDKLEKQLFPYDAEPKVKSMRYQGKKIWYYSVAAIILFLCALGWAILNQTEKVVWEYHQTAYGEQKNIVLPDGSEVVLNANSNIRYVADFTNGNRDVWLEGEAFFDVKTQANLQSFQVYTEDITVEVTGTSFNVNTHLGNPKVSLIEGKVRLMSATNASLSLNPGNSVFWDKGKEVFIDESSTVNQAVAWRYNKWIFDHSSLSEVFERLAYTYGLGYEIADTSLLKREVSGEISLENEDELIEAIAYLFDLQIEKRTNYLVIKEKP